MSRIRNGYKDRKRKYLTGNIKGEKCKTILMQAPESTINKLLKLQISHNEAQGDNITTVTSFIREIIEQYVNGEIEPKKPIK